MAQPSTKRSHVQARPHRSARPQSVTAPPRCNFAGFCSYCAERGCQKPACIAWYRATYWAVCELCDGLGSDGYGTSCLCLHGVVQVGSGYQGAVQPLGPRC